MTNRNRGILSGVKCWFSLLSDWDPELSPRDERMGTPNPTQPPRPVAQTTRQARPRVYSNAEPNAVITIR